MSLIGRRFIDRLGQKRVKKVTGSLKIQPTAADFHIRIQNLTKIQITN